MNDQFKLILAIGIAVSIIILSIGSCSKMVSNNGEPLINIKIE